MQEENSGKSSDSLLLRSTPFPFLDFWLPNLNCFSCFLRS